MLPTPNVTQVRDALMKGLSSAILTSMGFSGIGKQFSAAFSGMDTSVQMFMQSAKYDVEVSIQYTVRTCQPVMKSNWYCLWLNSYDTGRSEWIEETKTITVWIEVALVSWMTETPGGELITDMNIQTKIKNLAKTAATHISDPKWMADQVRKALERTVTGNHRITFP